MPPLHAAGPDEPAPPGRVERGRDPWVFRCIFEDRTRVVALTPAPGLWITFNPFTCGVFKAWTGAMNFRGKVWDFSQDNCAAQGKTLLEAPDLVLTLSDPAPSPGESDGPGAWTARNVEVPGYAFTSDGATLTSPVFDTTGWSRLFVAFDERSRRGPIRVEVSRDAGATWDAQWFHSCLHVDSDDQWQWNFKELVTRSERTRLRFVQEKQEYRKHIRAVRVFGDRPAWSGTCPGGSLPVTPEFKGYRFVRPDPGAQSGAHADAAAETLELMYDLRLGDDARGAHADAITARVRHRLDARPLPPRPGESHQGAIFTETISITGLPEGASLTLTLPSGASVQRRAGGRPIAGEVTFAGGAADGARVELVTEAHP